MTRHNSKRHNAKSVLLPYACRFSEDFTLAKKFHSPEAADITQQLISLGCATHTAPLASTGGVQLAIRVEAPFLGPYSLWIAPRHTHKEPRHHSDVLNGAPWGLHPETDGLVYFDSEWQAQDYADFCRTLQGVDLAKADEDSHGWYVACAVDGKNEWQHIIDYEAMIAENADICDVWDEEE